MSPQHENRREGVRSSPLAKGLLVTLGASIVLGAASFAFSPGQPSGGEEALRSGVAAIREGRPGEAEALFETAARDENPAVASAAYHNLALLALQEKKKKKKKKKKMPGPVDQRFGGLRLGLALPQVGKRV